MTLNMPDIGRYGRPQCGRWVREGGRLVVLGVLPGEGFAGAELDEEFPALPVAPRPRGLPAFDHFIQPMKADATSRTWVPDGAEALLRPMNPGFIDDKDALVTGSLQTALVDLLTGASGNTAFQKYLTKASIRDKRAYADDRIRVALVDLTGDKGIQPEFAGWGSTVQTELASAAKVAALYAAFQLLNDLRHVAAAESIAKTSELIRILTARWKAARVGGAPKLTQFLEVDADPPDVQASADTQWCFQNIISHDNANHAATMLIDQIGFPYIASLMWQSGLRHPQRGGLWLTRSYEGSGPVWSDAVSPPPGPIFGHTGSALSLATFYTLMAQGRLVNPTSSNQIKGFLSTATWLRPPLSSSATVASKVGLLLRCIRTGPKMSGGRAVVGRDGQPVTECKEYQTYHASEAGLIGNGALRYVVAMITTEVPEGVDVMQKLVVAMEDLIRARHP